MNAELAQHPAYRQLRETIARLELISHVSGTSYDARAPRATDDEPGGRRPPGGDRDRPRRPGPEPPGDASEQEHASYQERVDEWEAWLVSYQRRTAGFFRRELDRCESAFRLERLLEDAAESLNRWCKQPPLQGGIDPEPGSFFWKCAIADDPRPIDDVVNCPRYQPISRATVYRYRLKYRGLRRSLTRTV